MFSASSVKLTLENSPRYRPNGLVGAKVVVPVGVGSSFWFCRKLA